MKLRDHLTDDQKRKLNRMAKKKPPSLEDGGKVPKPMNMSKREVEELMGVNRDTYKKVNGKWRRK